MTKSFVTGFTSFFYPQSNQKIFQEIRDVQDFKVLFCINLKDSKFLLNSVVIYI